MNYYFSASKAEEMTSQWIDDCVERQLIAVFELIKNAITEGKFSISCSDITTGPLMPRTLKKLEELGYKIETGSQYNEKFYNISWK